MASTGFFFLCIVPLSGALRKQAWWWQNLWVLACFQRILFFLNYEALFGWIWDSGLKVLFFKDVEYWPQYSNSLLACRVSAERSAVSLMGFPLWVTRPFSLAALSIFFLFPPWWIWRLCALGLLFLWNIFVVFSVFPGFECWPALLGWGNFPG